MHARIQCRFRGVSAPPDKPHIREYALPPQSLYQAWQATCQNDLSAPISNDNGTLKRHSGAKRSTGSAPLAKPSALEEQTKITIISSVTVPTVAGLIERLPGKKPA